MPGEQRSISFRLAEPSDDPQLRRLLRESPMAGKISLSLQREPNFFRAAEIDAAEHRTIVAVENHEVVAMGSVFVRNRFLNGRPVRIGYLSSLRLAKSAFGRFDILRSGYRMLQSVYDALGIHCCFTSISTENRRAMRFLERGLPEMPKYRPIGELITVVMRSRSGRMLPAVQLASANELDDISNFLTRSLERYQLAPCWSNEELDSLIRRSDLLSKRIHVFREQSSINGCGALWDQRPFKQAVVSRYSPMLRLARPIYNLICPIWGGFKLPKAGWPLPHAFASHLACDHDNAEIFLRLIESLSAAAYHTGIEMLSIGLDARDSRIGRLQRNYATRLYRTRLYWVYWPEYANEIPEPDGRLFNPEIALL